MRKLGRLERAWVRLEAYAPIVFAGALHLSRAPSEAILRQALDVLQRRHAMLRVSIGRVGREVWYCAADAPARIPLEVIRCRDDDQWRRVLEEELGKGFDQGIAPLARFVLLQGAADSDLLCSFHHAIIDSRSGEALVDELLTTCAELMAGGALAEKPDAGILPPIEGLLPAEFRGLSRVRKTAGFLGRQMLEELRYRRRLGRRQAVRAAAPTRPRILRIAFAEDETRRLTRAARKRRQPLNSVLQAAMLLSLWRVRYRGQSLPMRGLSFGDLRPHLRPPPAPAHLGVYISMLQYSADVTPDTELWALAQLVTEKIDRSARSTDKFAAALASHQMIRFLLKRRSMRMGMVALSFPGPLSLAPQYGTIRLNGISGGITNNPLGPELAGFATILHNRLSLDLQYLESDMDAKDAETVARHIRHLLQDGGTAQEATR